MHPEPGNPAERGLNHEYIGAEHLVLGLIRCTDGKARAVLTNLDIDVNLLRHDIDTFIRESCQLPIVGGHSVPLAKRVIEASVKEAASKQRKLVDTGHLLLGLVQEDRGAIGQMLRERGVTPETVHDQIHRLTETGIEDEPPPNLT